MADTPKPLKTILANLRKAAEGQKPDKLACAVGELIAAVPGKAAPKNASAAPGAGRPPSQEDIEEIKECLDAFAEANDDLEPQRGLFGGGLNWKVVVPILVDLAKKFLDGILAEPVAEE